MAKKIPCTKNSNFLIFCQKIKGKIKRKNK